MSIDRGFHGTVNLKPGVTLSQIATLWGEEPSLPLEPEGSLDLGDGSVTVQDGELDYDIYTTSWTFAEQFEEFLTELAAKYAASGWIDYDPQDHDNETAYGPTPLAALEAVRKARLDDLTTAQAALAVVEAKIAELS